MPMNILFFFQIILESLPISSSGHLALLSLLSPTITPLPFSITLLAHIPTLAVLACTMRKYVLNWLCSHSYMRIIKDFSVITFATIVTACGVITTHFLAPFISFRLPLWYGFTITALLLFNLKSEINTSKMRQFLVFHDGLWLGIAQSLALLPGISRFIITLTAGLMLGFEYRYAFMISCSLQAFLCLGGSALLVLKGLSEGDFSQYYLSSAESILLFISFLMASLLFFEVIQRYVKNQLWMMGTYMCCIACLTYFLEHT